MIDSFVLLTPILILVVVSLLVFVGCDVVFGLDRLDKPTGFAATTRSQRVDLTWNPYPNAEKFYVWRREGQGDHEKIATKSGSETFHKDTDGLVNDTEYFYQLSVVLDGDEGDRTADLPATPNPVSFVKTKTLTTARNDFTGSVGMSIVVAGEDLDVVTLGRPYALGNVQTHTLKIVDELSKAVIASVMLDTMQLPRSVGDFQYAPLPAPVTLTAGRTYYILSSEVSGGDQFYRHDATVTTTEVAAVGGAIFEQAGTFMQDETAPRVYPVDLQY
ncbi:MAG TPA: fibronectin type III domain-containing protein [Gemmatimonadaceae bacterium]|nr:fibronectin type III domain-containing protein [Gemmatimonadaceae bacterium]